MFVLPPPPRYPSGVGYAVTAPVHTTMIETNNILSTPSGPEYQFLVGEGTYVLKEDLQLATPPPHPSEAPVLNPNPLATTPQAATAGTKISLASLVDVRPPPASPMLFRGSMSTLVSATNAAGLLPQQHHQQYGSIKEHPNENPSSSGAGEPKVSSSGGSDDGRATGTSMSDAPPNSVPSLGSAPAFGEGTAAVAPTNAKDAGKRKKPKNNMTKSNSSFISRVIVSETLSKRLQDRPADGFFIFANINRAFQWLDLSSPTKAEYLTKILFTKAHCLCHEVNSLTKSPSHVDLIMGFSTGEIIWWEPISQRYTRLNKNGAINASPVSEIKWIPGSENLFLAAHMDGTLVVYDKEKEDAIFTPEEEERTSSGEWNGWDGISGVHRAPELHIHKSVHSKNQKVNPVASWKLSNQRINAFAFSPDRRHIAVVSEDGTLRIIDYLSEKLLDLFYSYYGGLTCVCWSPDGKYVLTGGQDDMVSIWAIASEPGTLSGLAARCQGHQSWVTAVAFDPWRCDERSYRFGSVAEDCRLCLWDFSVGMLHRPRAASVNLRGRGGQQRANSSATASAMGGAKGGAIDLATRLRSDSSLSAAAAAGVGGGGEADDGGAAFAAAGWGDAAIAHPVEPRARTSILPPVSKKVVDVDPLCWLEFTEDAILTSCKSGHVRTWSRPSIGEPVADGRD